MKTFFKYVIVGGGPSGMTCALSLRKRGENPCVVDKAEFPRTKTCGGLVTEKTFRLIRKLLSEEEIAKDLFCNQTSKADLYYKTQRLAEGSLQKPLRFVQRAEFDNALVRAYKEAGGTILESCGEYTIEYENNRILFSEDLEISYDALIFADGVFSRSRKLIPSPMKDLSFGLETFLPKEAFPANEVRLYFGYADHGYLWVFPYGDKVCVGVCANYQKKPEYKRILKTFLRENGADPEGLRLEGAFFPGGVPVLQRKLPDNVLCVGDAAGFADPISGEGLFFALLSGIAAARAFLFEGSPKESYLQSMKPVFRILKEGRSLQSIFYRPSVQRYFLRHIRGNRSFVQFFFDRQVSEYGYSYQKFPRLYLDYKHSGNKNVRTL